jgi:hypothetical protein
VANFLVEIEKSAEKAAEIAHDLAAFSRQDKDVESAAGRKLERTGAAHGRFVSSATAQEIHVERSSSRIGCSR